MDENKHTVQQEIIRASNTCKAYFSPLMATDVLCGLGSGAENCVRNRAKLLGNLGTETSFSRSASSLKSPASILNNLPPWKCVSSTRSGRRQRITNKNGNGYIQAVKSRRWVWWKLFKLYGTQTWQNKIYDFVKEELNLIATLAKIFLN